jgi:hypothetical protein
VMRNLSTQSCPNYKHHTYFGLMAMRHRARRLHIIKWRPSAEKISDSHEFFLPQ